MLRLLGPRAVEQHSHQLIPASAQPDGKYKVGESGRRWNQMQRGGWMPRWARLSRQECPALGHSCAHTFSDMEWVESRHNYDILYTKEGAFRMKKAARERININAHFSGVRTPPPPPNIKHRNRAPQMTHRSSVP